MKLSGVSLFFSENTRKNFKLNFVLVLSLVLKSKALNLLINFFLSKIVTGRINRKVMVFLTLFRCGGYGTW